MNTSSGLYRTPLYRMIGNLLTIVETSDAANLVEVAKTFWAELEETLTNQLAEEVEPKPKNSCEERVVALFRSLFGKKNESKKKSIKVMFKSPSASEMPSKVSNLTAKETPETAKLGTAGVDFVHCVTLKSFQMAHQSMSSTHLRIFAQLLELSPDEDIVAKVITSCHGDVETETTSHYFVFHICIPWLHSVQKDGNIEDFTHLVKVTCIFLSVLDNESTSQLLDKLYEVSLV